MKIDRTRFLLLTTTLAASTAAAVISTTGCNTTNNDTDAGTSSGGVDSGGGGSDSGPTTEGGDAGGGSDGGGDAASCLGNTSSSPTCAPVTEGMDGGTNCPTQCQDVVAKYKTDVANALVECLNSSPTCEGVEPSCVQAVFDKVCTDSAAETTCAPLVAKCADAGVDGGPGAFTHDACVSTVSALTDTAKTTFTTCVAEGTDCDSCLATARTPL